MFKGSCRRGILRRRKSFYSIPAFFFRRGKVFLEFFLICSCFIMSSVIVILTGHDCVIERFFLSSWFSDSLIFDDLHGCFFMPRELSFPVLFYTNIQVLCLLLQIGETIFSSRSIIPYNISGVSG